MVTIFSKAESLSSKKSFLKKAIEKFILKAKKLEISFPTWMALQLIILFKLLAKRLKKDHL
jgi:hypothetical protein